MKQIYIENPIVSYLFWELHNTMVYHVQLANGYLLIAKAFIELRW